MTGAVADDPNMVAEQLTGRSYISYSAISTYQQCPLKYYFTYVEGLPKESVSANLVFGGAIHAVVEFHYQEILAGSPPPDLDTLLAVYHEAWRAYDLDDVHFGQTADVNSLGLLAEKMLTAFRQSNLANPSGSIIGIEEELRGQLVEECPDLLARVDLITEDCDTLIVTDLKTARSRWSQSQVEQNADQLLLYSELVQRLLPGRDLNLQFAVITKTKWPTIQTHTVEIDAARLQRTKRTLERVWKAIENGHFYPAPTAMGCPSCSYRQACRAWTG